MHLRDNQVAVEQCQNSLGLRTFVSERLVSMSWRLESYYRVKFLIE